MFPVPAAMSSDELGVRLHQQSLVAAFGLFALEHGPVQLLLDEAARIAAEGLTTKLAKVLQSRPAIGDLLVIAGVGWRAGVVGHGTLGGGMDSPAGFTLHTGQPTLANHLGQEQRFRVPALLAEHGVQSAINVIVGQPNQTPYGVLEADSTRRHDFVHADIAFLQALANVLAAGLARAEVEAAKDMLLSEKDLLMREVHHRVSNSLQLVRTMLGLQGRAASEETRAELEAAAGRIMSIAAVHRRLYDGGSVFESDAAGYLQGLMNDLRSMLSEERTIEVETEPMMLSADAMTPLGLIVSELVTNAVKHGAGVIRVRLRNLAPGVQVSVDDEGPGFPPAGEPGRRGLGMRLVSSFAKGGAVEIDRSVPFGRVVVTLKP